LPNHRPSPNTSNYKTISKSLQFLITIWFKDFLFYLRSKIARVPAWILNYQVNKNWLLISSRFKYFWLKQIQCCVHSPLKKRLLFSCLTFITLLQAIQESCFSCYSKNENVNSFIYVFLIPGQFKSKTH